MRNILIIGFLTMILSSACSNEEVKTEKVVEADEETTEDITIEPANEKEKVTPQQLAENMGDQNSDVEYLPYNQTFSVEFSSGIENELKNENNQFLTDSEYEEMLKFVTGEYVDVSEMIYDYFGSGYSIEIVLSSDVNKTLLLITDKEVRENNLDLRNDKNSEFISELDEEQYKLLGDYINIDYRNYADNLEGIIERNYNFVTTTDEYIKELDKAYSELDHLCKDIMLSKDTEETLSDDMSELAANAFQSCFSLKMMHMNLMINTTSDTELDATNLEESAEFYKLAKEGYESYQ